MNKKGDAGWLVVKWVIALLVFLVIAITIFPRLRDAARSATNCGDAGGECLPMWTEDRELITGHHGVYTDCKELQDKSPTKYGCFIRKGPSVGIQDETIPAGLHLFQLTYDEYPAPVPAPNPAPSGPFRYLARSTPEKQRLEGQQIILEEGRLYAFQAYSKDNRNKFCSVYLREGVFSPDDNIKGTAVRRQRCDDPNNPPTLFFVPTQAHVKMNNLHIVLLPRETPDGQISDGKIEISVRIRPVLNPCELFFYEHEGTDIEALRQLSDRNPVSFNLESSFARFEFVDVRIQPRVGESCLRIEENVITREMQSSIPFFITPFNIMINGEYFGFTSGSINVIDKNIKPASASWWPSISVNPVVSSWNKDTQKWERPDNYKVERIFSEGNKISYSILQPKAEMMAFRYFPGRCYEIKDEDMCFTLTSMSTPDILSCYWTDKRSGQCLPCRGDQYTEMIRSCEDYPEISCNMHDICNVNPGRGCKWNNRRLLRDKCVDAGFQGGDDCDGWRECSDYKDESSCEGNRCSENKCEWKKRWYASDTCVAKQTIV